MEFIEASLFGSEHSKFMNDEDIAELCDILGVPLITKDETYVMMDLKFIYEGRERHLKVEVEAVDGYEVRGGFDPYEDSYHGYLVDITVLTNYDEDDGFDKFYPRF